jgi:hypothetical protein
LGEPLRFATKKAHHKMVRFFVACSRRAIRSITFAPSCTRTFGALRIRSLGGSAAIPLAQKSKNKGYFFVSLK